jgi:hypothetical protein
MTERANIYRVRYISPHGYIVYRHLAGERDNDVDAMVHRVATFVARIDAQHYANFRNHLIDERGSDAIDAEEQFR